MPQPNTKVLDFSWGPFWNGFNGDNFSGGFLELFQLPQEVPETRLGHNWIGGEDPHFIKRSCLFLLGGQFAPDDFIFLQLEKNSNNVKHNLKKSITMLHYMKYFLELSSTLKKDFT